MSCVTCDMSCVTCHLSCHLSCVTCHTFFLGGAGTKWWSLTVEGLLSTGPTPSSFTICLYLYPYFLPRLIQSIGHNVYVFVVCQPRPVTNKLIKCAILRILCIYAQNIPFMGVYQDVLLLLSTFLHQWLHIYCRIQNTKYKLQWWEYKNMLVHKKTSL